MQFSARAFCYNLPTDERVCGTIGNKCHYGRAPCVLKSNLKREAIRSFK